MIPYTEFRTGEYYTHENGNIFLWDKTDSHNYLGNTQTQYSTRSSFKDASAERLATPFERQWLYACIKANEFIPRSKIIEQKEQQLNYSIF